MLELPRKPSMCAHTHTQHLLSDVVKQLEQNCFPDERRGMNEVRSMGVFGFLEAQVAGNCKVMF